MADEPFKRFQERRAFSRLNMRAPVEITQGDARWTFTLIDLSLTGLGVTEPDDWDPDYGKPFSMRIALKDGTRLRIQSARLIHINPGHMGFEIKTLATDQRALLAQTLAAAFGREVIEEELKILAELEGQD